MINKKILEDHMELEATINNEVNKMLEKLYDTFELEENKDLKLPFNGAMGLSYDYFDSENIWFTGYHYGDTETEYLPLYLLYDPMGIERYIRELRQEKIAREKRSEERKIEEQKVTEEKQRQLYLKLKKQFAEDE